MNVQPGDLARIVGHPTNSGRMVKVLRADLLMPTDWACEALQTLDGFLVIGPFGLFGQQPMKIAPGSEVDIPDENLRPLYDGDAEDEMLRLTGKPASKPTELTPCRQVEFAR